MKVLRDLLDQAEPLFHKGGAAGKVLRSIRRQPIHFLYTPGRVTDGPTHVRDGIDLKRTMITVRRRARSLHFHGHVEHGLSDQFGHAADGGDHDGRMARNNHRHPRHRLQSR